MAVNDEIYQPYSLRPKVSVIVIIILVLLLLFSSRVLLQCYFKKKCIFMCKLKLRA